MTMHGGQEWTGGSKPTTQPTVLRAVGDVLCENLTPFFNSKNVFYTLDPSPVEGRRLNIYATITPMDGSFEQDVLDGGGANVCIEQSGVMIGIWSMQISDKIGEADQVLFGIGDDKTRALLHIKQLILKAFTGRMLIDPEDSQPILTELMSPIQARTPTYDNSNRKTADMSIGFSTAFEWDLT